MDVKSADPTICVVHEEPRPKGWLHWRHFLLTALRAGETRIDAFLAGTLSPYSAPVIVKVIGHASVRMVFFPGERLQGSQTVGTIYVIGSKGESMRAAGGPPVGGPDRGGHTIEPTPAGHYVLGPRIHVIAPSWPDSVIPWGAALRLNGGEVEYENPTGVWRLATGPRGAVTSAEMAFKKRSGLHPKLSVIVAQVRDVFVDPSTGSLRSAVWEKNDFGRWGWNLRRNGHQTPYFIHTTPDDEQTSALGRAVFLKNSHGWVHLVPSERDRMMSAGILKQGTPFEVRPYTETGPP